MPGSIAAGRPGCLLPNSFYGAEGDYLRPTRRLAPPSLHGLCQLIHPTTLMTSHRWHRRLVLCPATAVTIPRADPAIFSSIRDHSHRRCGNQASRGDGLHGLPLIHEKGIYNVVFIDAEYAVELLAQALELGYAPSAYQ